MIVNMFNLPFKLAFFHKTFPASQELALCSYVALFSQTLNPSSHFFLLLKWVPLCCCSEARIEVGMAQWNRMGGVEWGQYWRLIKVLASCRWDNISEGFELFTERSWIISITYFDCGLRTLFKVVYLYYQQFILLEMFKSISIFYSEQWNHYVNFSVKILKF